ncbi:glutathione S-transferase family protein [Microbulbifer agarilyticus]|uniref:glutathione S-transferase family protein n=1 Tax=Microbulbifer agarilyticus TaxID=260552 RepID=UPI001C93A02A|nr:glutathione S-transferase family protein [Microbulbifer agarilyticus]MBY6189528.1 glutathione S-transferase family protein [Microbulbifer agarilyticus]MBY6210800.1 glutathione S-transferase family protein [Microbulbifer agarilyticus]
MQLYIGNKNYSSWSLRPWLLATELKIPFEEMLVPFDEGGSWDKFRAFSPTGLVPCLVDGEATVWDSLAIAEYLYEANPAVWPADKVARAWARCAAAEMHAGFFALRNQCSMNCGVTVSMHQVDAALEKDLARLEELWEQGLDRFGGPFLAGDTFTAVDAFFAPVVFRLYGYQLSLGDKAMAYAEHIRALPGMQTWYEEALKEPWREVAHDQELEAVGTIVEDRRQ